jgi:transposase
MEGQLNEAQWAVLEPFVIETGPLRGRPPSNHRRILDGIFWVARTKSTWRSLPEEFGQWGAVYGQFHRWTQAGLWDLLLDALGDSARCSDACQNSDSRTSAAGCYLADAKEELTKTLLAVRAIAPQQKLPPCDRTDATEPWSRPRDYSPRRLKKPLFAACRSNSFSSS